MKSFEYNNVHSYAEYINQSGWHLLEIIDEVVLCLYKNSKSFTGEDVIEINCHGSIYIQNRIIEILLLLGCRLARPGEFTLRAFLNGKIDKI